MGSCDCRRRQHPPGALFAQNRLRALHEWTYKILGRSLVPARVESRQELCVPEISTGNCMNRATRQEILIYTKYLIYKLETISDFYMEKPRNII